MSTLNRNREVIGGITTFLTMSYIVVVNPAILSTEGTGMTFSGVMAATVLLCVTMTLLMGLYAKLPYAVAPGLGINAFFTYNVILSKQVPWTIALGIVCWAGILFFLASVTPLRIKIVEAIPMELRSAAAVGMGMLLAFIGLKNSGFIVASPDTFVQFGSINFEVTMSLLGFLITAILYERKSAFAFLAPMVLITGISALLGRVHWPETVWMMPDFKSVFFKMDMMGALHITLLPVMISIFLTDLFDSISTFVGVAKATGLTDETGQPKNIKQGLIVDSFATFFAGVFGTSSGTAYIESAAGIEAGGRGGLSAVVTALCFIPLFFLSPLAAMIPGYAIAPVLIFVGYLMFRSIEDIRVDQFEIALPSFVTIMLIPLTFSITQGILWGFLTSIAAHWIVGKQNALKPLMYVIGLLSLLLLAVGH